MNDSFQVINHDPNRASDASEKVYENIYCVGDICQTSRNEEKSVFPLRLCADVAASNIIKHAGGNPNYRKMPSSFPKVAFITLGTENGVMIMGDNVQMGKFVSDGKTGFQESQMKQYNGDV